MLVMARWMSEAGHHVEVVVPLDSKSWEQGAKMELDMSPAPASSRAWFGGTARRWAKGRACDILWIRDRRDLGFAGMAAKALGASMIMQQAMQIPKPKKAPWHWLRQRHVDAWVCGLHHLKEECLARTTIEEARCHVLPLPLDDRWFAPKTADEGILRAELNLPENTWLMGTVGRLDPQKGQRTALKALAQLPEHVHWVFVGDNTVNDRHDERAALRSLANELGVNDRAHFLASRDDVLSVFDAMDGFGMTSDSETIGTVTLEAMAREVPVIGTDSGGTSELLDAGRGQLVPPRDPEALASAIASLMEENPQSLSARTRTGRDYAAKCRPSRLVPAWEELLASLAESRRKA